MTAIIAAIGAVSGLVGAIYGIAKIFNIYFPAKTDQQKVDDLNHQIDQEEKKFEETGRPE